MTDLRKAVDLIKAIERRRATHKLDYYDPYEYQKKFHHALGKDTLTLAVQRALMAANQIGKTFCGAMEISMHLTGQYPIWWEGHRFNKPVEVMVGSNTNETCRDICQKELFGDPADDKLLGTGTVPIDCIGVTNRKPGVPNAFESVMVQHISGGWSKCMLRAYEQGAKKFMGLRIDVGWCDEEPPMDIWAQFLRATFSTNGILFITFTPEEGVTEVVHGFVNDLSTGQCLVQAGWDDAPHMTPEKQQQKLQAMAPHEREMRTKGVPLMGSGLVFPVLEDAITISPIEILKHWPRIVGVDFGYDHPFAAVFIAWDRDSDIVYIYDVYREKKALMPMHAAAVNAKGGWIPVMWPHDGLVHDKKSGKPLADIYRDEFKMNMHKEPFSNPASPGQKEGSGGNGVEVGIMEILNRMETGRFKVFSTCKDWFEEFRMYHRKNGEIVKLNDDIMSATRYGVMSLRHAQTQTFRIRPQQIAAGARNW